MDELLALMERQQALCERLLQATVAERAMVEESRLDDLEAATRDKAGLIVELEGLEAVRSRIARSIAVERGLDAGASLAELALALPDLQRTAVEEQRDSVRRVVSSLRDANDQNLEIMNRSLGLVRESMRNLRRIAGAGETYDRGGRSRWNAVGTLAVNRQA